MNKTVNINLAGIFFHIDEDAYTKLQHYLEAIKLSFTNSQGRDEILADIEARIAELFGEKRRNDRQVIGVKEVEEVIAIMGQPEDYVVDEEIFENEEPTSTAKTTQKQLYRDTEHSYVGGVSSGLGHYLGVKAIWIRILWILLTIGSSGAFILIYIALWIFVPEAKTTADKLAMRGEEVTISNIERKIREGFDDVTDRVKSADYQEYGKKAKSGANSAATAIGDIITFILNIFVKLVGILILLIAGATLISLFIGLFTVGTFGIIDAPWADYVEMATSGAPFWLISLLSFFAVGIPFFFLFILGLKILVKNLKTIGTPAKLVLLGLWLLSIIGLTVIGIQQATNRAFDGESLSTETIAINPQDTLYLRMQKNPAFSGGIFRNGSFDIRLDENDNKVLYSNDIRLVVKSTQDSKGILEILRKAEGKNSEDARERADNINYNTRLSNNELLLDAYLTSDMKYKFRDQEVWVTLYLPEGSVLFADKNTNSFHRNSHEDILKNGQEGKYLQIIENGTFCPDCPIEGFEDKNNRKNETNDFNARINIDGEEMDIQINEKGIKVNNKKAEILSIDNSGIKINSN